MRLMLAVGFLLLAAQSAEARTPAFVECTKLGCGAPPAWRQHEQSAKRAHKRRAKKARHATVKAAIVAKAAPIVEAPKGATILPHPPGCPRTSFCGCGVALRVFGKPVRDLWLAANWFRFPAAVAAAGMVAVRKHHVFFIERVLGDGKVLAYDPNSGHHLTRLHVRSLGGYSVRNPQLASAAAL